jgi:hypothetical protein
MQKLSFSSVIFLICLFHSSLSALTCASGFYDPGTGTRCYQCNSLYQTCTASAQGVAISSLTAFISATAGGVTYSDFYCPLTSGSAYNWKTGNCELWCATGCTVCIAETTFCLNCANGYVWNNYTCIPAVIGLEAASLALLFITLVFLIIACCYVNKARK